MFVNHVLEWAVTALRDWGVEDHALSMILYGMIAARLSYREALAIYAEYLGTVPELVHADCCYKLLAASVDVQPGTLLEFLSWKGAKENENRVPVGQGS